MVDCTEPSPAVCFPAKTLVLCWTHKHLRNIDCLTACTPCLVCFIGTVNGRSKKKKEKKPIMSGASSGHTTKLKQSILLRCLWLDHYATGAGHVHLNFNQSNLKRWAESSHGQTLVNRIKTGRIFISKSSCVHGMHYSCCVAKRPNL